MYIPGLKIVFGTFLTDATYGNGTTLVTLPMKCNPEGCDVGIGTNTGGRSLLMQCGTGNNATKIRGATSDNGNISGVCMWHFVASVE